MVANIEPVQLKSGKLKRKDKVTVKMECEGSFLKHNLKTLFKHQSQEYLNASEYIVVSYKTLWVDG